MGPLRVSNVLQPDNRIAAGPWVGWAHGGVCSVCGRAQWPWRVLRTAGVAGVRVYFWARVRWVLGSSGVGAFCVRARLGSCCAGVFLLRSGPCCVARILGAVGRPPIYACGLGIWRRGAYSVRGFGFILFVMRWIVPLCLILTAFFPPFPGASAETLRRNLLFEGTMLMR